MVDVKKVGYGPATRPGDSVSIWVELPQSGQSIPSTQLRQFRVEYDTVHDTANVTWADSQGNRSMKRRDLVHLPALEGRPAISEERISSAIAELITRDAKARPAEKHDELMARAKVLSAESPGGRIRRVWHDVLKHARGLRRVVVSELQRHGVLADHRRDEEDIVFDEDALMEYTEAQLRREHFGLSTEELANGIAKGIIALDDERIAVVSRLAARLRAATVEATRLERLLTIDPFIRTAECIGAVDEYDSDGDYGRLEKWISPAGYFIVRHFVIGGLFGEGWENRWRIMIFAATEDWEIVAEGRPVGGTPDSYDGLVSHEVIKETIARLDFYEVVNWISGFTGPTGRTDASVELAIAGIRVPQPWSDSLRGTR